MAQSQERGDAAPASARFERRLAALLGELENPLATESILRAHSESCAEAFEELQRDAAMSTQERARLRGLVAATLNAAARELEATRGRLKLTQSVLRASRSSGLADPIGGWCDIAG